jgi:cation transport protein ChaC
VPARRPSTPRDLSLTLAHLARVARAAEDPGPNPGLTPLDDAGMDRAADAFLAARGDGPFWVFAYGSLIWNPAFDHVETRRAVAHGWRRSFCMHMTRWRATPDRPGLMLALERGGACVGVAYRMPDDDPHGRMVRLLKREVAYVESLSWQRWLPLRTSDGPIRALTFYCAPRHDPDFVRLPVETKAARIAHAVGHAGGNAEYLFNTVRHLEELGIHDRYLWRLQALVAAEIDAIDD